MTQLPVFSWKSSYRTRDARYFPSLEEAKISKTPSVAAKKTNRQRWWKLSSAAVARTISRLLNQQTETIRTYKWNLTTAASQALSQPSRTSSKSGSACRLRQARQEGREISAPWWTLNASSFGRSPKPWLCKLNSNEKIAMKICHRRPWLASSSTIQNE